MKQRKAWKRHIFDAKQVAWLRTNAATKSQDEMIAHLGCSRTLLKRWLRDLKLTHLKRRYIFTDAEKETLRRLGGTMPIRLLVVEMNRDHIFLRKRAREMGINIIFRHSWKKDEEQELRRLAKEGLSASEIAARMNTGYDRVWMKLKRSGLAPKPSRVSQPRPPRAAKPAPAPRERVGITQFRAIRVDGQVKHCDRCHAPVVDTPEKWAEHNLRVHVVPIFPPPMSTRRIA